MCRGKCHANRIVPAGHSHPGPPVTPARPVPVDVAMNAVSSLPDFFLGVGAPHSAAGLGLSCGCYSPHCHAEGPPVLCPSLDCPFTISGSFDAHEVVLLKLDPFYPLVFGVFMLCFQFVGFRSVASTPGLGNGHIVRGRRICCNDCPASLERVVWV